MSVLHIVAVLTALCPGATVLFDNAPQEIDFGQIDKFDSFGTGTLPVGTPADL